MKKISIKIIAVLLAIIIGCSGNVTFAATLPLTATAQSTSGTASWTGGKMGQVALSWGSSATTGYKFTVTRNGTKIVTSSSATSTTDTGAVDSKAPNKPTFGTPTYTISGSDLYVKMPVSNISDNGTTYKYVATGSATMTPAEFAYTGGVQSFKAPYGGKYKLEVWGAQGTEGGKGGYAVATVTLNANQTIYINVGGQGSTFNGGGYRSDRTTNNQIGGGATSIQKTNRGQLSAYSSYRGDIYIVAGGGGAKGDDSEGGNGGGGNQSGTSIGYKTASYDYGYWQVPSGLGATTSAGGVGAGQSGNNSWIVPSKTSNNISGEKSTYAGSSGSFGTGGCGGYQRAFTIGRNDSKRAEYATRAGAGGGGGYYGGGGGGLAVITEHRIPNKNGNWIATGAGGGSGYIKSDLSYNPALQRTGNRSGNGYARISLIEATSGGTITSNEVSTTVTSGIYSTYYKFDTSATTNMTADNKNTFTKGYSSTTNYKIARSGQYLHVANVDKAGNIGSTNHYLFSTYYLITYDLNGGREVSGKENPRLYNATTGNFTLNMPVRDGYYFAGWTGSNGTTRQRSVTVDCTWKKDLTYKANWISKTAVVTTPTISGSNLYVKDETNKIYYVKSGPHDGNTYSKIQFKGYTIDEKGNKTWIPTFAVTENRFKIKESSTEVYRNVHTLPVGLENNTDGTATLNTSYLNLKTPTNSRNMTTYEMTSSALMNISEDNKTIKIYPQTIVNGNESDGKSADWDENKKITVISDGKAPIITSSDDNESWIQITITDRQADDNPGSGINQSKTKMYIVPKDYVYNPDTINTDGYDILSADSNFIKKGYVVKGTNGDKTTYTFSFDLTNDWIREFFSTKKDIIVISTDNVNNTSIFQTRVKIGIAIQASIVNNTQETPPSDRAIFKSGENGTVNIKLTGYVNHVDVEFPEEVYKYKPEYEMVSYDEITNVLDPILTKFIIDKNADEVPDYVPVKITAYDDEGRSKEAYVYLKIEKRLKDEFITRIRSNY